MCLNGPCSQKVGMYVYMYIHVCEHVYIFIYEYMCICSYIYVYVYIHVYLCIYIMESLTTRFDVFKWSILSKDKQQIYMHACMHRYIYKRNVCMHTQNVYIYIHRNI
jgi:hypothetical protein